jgi:hypothetical protein
MADAISDTTAAVDQALDDQARFSVDAAQARHVEIVYQLLKTVPYHTGRYESRAPYPTFEDKPDAADFHCPGDAVDVDPADVPDLPGLAAVAPESGARISTWPRMSAA